MADVAYNPLPAREQILSLLDYESDTGLFRWRETRRNRKRGAVAGWRAGQYIRIKFEGVNYGAHRLAYVVMTGNADLEGFDVDHINGDKSDNRWCNLRLATRSENVHNAPPAIVNHSGFRGVQWRPYNRKWIAKITVANRIYHLGTFISKDEAIAARLAAEARFGVFRHGISGTDSE